MREAVPTPGGVDEFSPTVAPTSRPESSKVTEAATGVPVRVDEHTDALLGAVLAERYRIERRLGAGGMGAVYVGTHLTLAKKVAVKVIQPRLGADATIAQRFIQEARAASAIGHEHIVQITDFGATADGGSFLVMEYLDGEDLSETLRRDGPLPWPRVIHLGEQIAWALAAAHKNGIVHRDIKPANCFRVPREHDPDFIKVLDFGLAKVTTVDDRREGESLTHTGMLLGTPGYIAPELYRGLKADHRVDIYALGALMHKLLTGELPPMGGNDEREPMRGLPAPDAVATVLGKALRENPDQRWSTAQELAQALRAIPRTRADEPTLVQRVHSGAVGREPTPTSAPREPSLPGLATREPTPVSFSGIVTVERDGSRVRLSLGVPALLILVSLVAVVVYVLTRRDEPPQPALQDMSIKSGASAPTPPVAAPPSAPPPALVVAPPPPEAAPPAPEQPPPVAAAPADGPPAPPPFTAPAPPPAATPSPPEAPKPPPRGTVSALSKKLRRCLKGVSLSKYYEVNLDWKTDAAGNIDDSTVTLPANQPQPIPTALKDCITETVTRSEFTWKPSQAYKQLVPIGTPPPPTDAAG